MLFVLVISFQKANLYFISNEEKMSELVLWLLYVYHFLLDASEKVDIQTFFLIIINILQMNSSTEPTPLVDEQGDGRWMSQVILNVITLQS